MFKNLNKTKSASVKRKRKNKKTARTTKLSKYIRLCIWIGSIFILSILSFILILFLIYGQNLPTIAVLKNYQPKTVTYIYSEDGVVIGEYSTERRIVKPLNEIPIFVQQAFIAVEDSLFYQHHGINFRAILRAALINISTGSNSQGASTITQQVVKSFLLSSEKTYERKIKEAILAWKIEGSLTKEQILYLYLNQIYFGEGAYGLEAASLTYFDKHVESLTLAEAAMLAGITQAPTSKNPIVNPSAARTRQIHALNRMLKVGFINTEEYKNAIDEVVHIRIGRFNPNTEMAPYFTEHIRRTLEEKLGQESLYNDGWKIYTTLNMNYQKAADKAAFKALWEYGRRRGFKNPDKNLSNEVEIEEFLKQVNKTIPPEGLRDDCLYPALITLIDDKKSNIQVQVGSYAGVINKNNYSWAIKGPISKKLKVGDIVWVRALDSQPEIKEIDISTLAIKESQTIISFSLERQTDVEIALLSMDVTDGGIKAMIGGRDFKQSQFNRSVQSVRQPGSSFKPILYAAALENGFSPDSVMIDGPVVFDDYGSGKRWKPMNADLKFKGPMTLYNALAASRNSISIKLLETIGFKALQSTAKNMGIKAEIPEYLPVALGAVDTTMPEMLTAFSAFPNMGIRVEPRYISRIEDRNGKIIAEFKPVFYKSIAPETACMVHSMLQGVITQGTGTVVNRIGRPIAGKSGTTNNYSDAWFIGYSPEYATAVWMGTDQLKPNAVGEVGGRAAAPVFLYYMEEILKHIPVRNFMIPEGVEIIPGGLVNGVCYKKGLRGNGISETVIEEENNFLKDDFEEDVFDQEAL